MRAIAVILAAAGCHADPNPPGRLVCEDGARTFEARVAAGALEAVRDRADRADLVDCRFEPGPPTIARWDGTEPRRDVPGIDRVPPPPPPPPPPRAAMSIPPSSLEGNRVAGTTTVLPDATTQDEIRMSGKDKVIGSFKLCVTDEGEVSSVSALKSTGFGGYDDKITRELRTWRYAPYIYNGAPTPVCTAVTFLWTVP